MKIIKITSLLLLVTFFSGSCSKDDKQEPNFELGKVTLSITGDVEGTFSGIADFDVVSTSQTQVWTMNMYDYNPQIFSLSLVDISIEDVSRPEPGVYTIGSSVSADYSAVFDYFPGGNYEQGKSYSTSHILDGFIGSDTYGILTITSSNDNTVQGSFEFNAHRLDDRMNVIGTVKVVAEFTANKRISQ